MEYSITYEDPRNSTIHVLGSAAWSSAERRFAVRMWRGVPEGERLLHWMKAQRKLKQLSNILHYDESRQTNWAYTPSGDTGPTFDGFIKVWMRDLD